jgi:hypothetical protein
MTTDAHRLILPDDFKCVDFSSPFSSFNYVENSYGNSANNSPIRRIFSLARSLNSKTFIIEKITSAGIIKDENDEIKQYFPDYRMGDLHRISFWTSSFSDLDDVKCNESNLLGYAIFKHDIAFSHNKYDSWHVFEAVFKKFPHEYNCVPCPCKYSVSLAGKTFSVQGLLYAQQNGLNKACAQVALRSLISRIIQPDISYRQINNFARKISHNFNPSIGLNTMQIRSVLTSLNIPFRDMDYTQHDKSSFISKLHTNKIDMRKGLPYQSYLYAGIESGMGALVGFKLDNSIGGKHIIPFYGHTFNKDTWAPDADKWYFKAGNLGYIPSQYWTSSFLGHDDNFGANYCVPRLYMQPDQVDYVAEILKPNFLIRGAQAEGLSLQLLYSIIGYLEAEDNHWLKRLIIYTKSQQIVLRAIAINKEKYISHISNVQDWDSNSEFIHTIDLFSKRLPESFWVVEISIPQLFPANERKLGEILINGQVELNINDIYRNLLYIRLPGGYYMLNYPSSTDVKYFPSNFISHLPVIKMDKDI